MRWNFWARWHISLSTWFRDYIYFPLGAGRGGKDSRLAKALAALGVEVTMKVFPDTSHGFIPHFMPHWQEAGAMIVKAILNTSL